jgi:hypothetical protein
VCVLAPLAHCKTHKHVHTDHIYKLGGGGERGGQTHTNNQVHQVKTHTASLPPNPHANVVVYHPVSVYFTPV